MDDLATAFGQVVPDPPLAACAVALQLLTAVLRGPLEPGLDTAIRYTKRLEEIGAMRSVGSRGDGYDNALAESVNGLYKAEAIHRQGPWRSLEQVELATAAWVQWWNERRLHSATANLPPAEFEALYYRQHQGNEAA